MSILALVVVAASFVVAGALSNDPGAAKAGFWFAMVVLAIGAISLL